eukprot:COSAG04_NODE_283_length_18154_cov_432.957020_8_plen_234_part_00
MRSWASTRSSSASATRPPPTPPHPTPPRAAEQRRRGGSDRSPGLASDVSPTNVLGKADEIKQLLADHGLSCCAFAASCEASELDEVRLLAEGAAAVGCPLVRLGCRRYPADGSLDYNEMFDEAVAHYAAALEVTRSFGVKIIVEMHGGTLHPSASLAHRIVSNFSSDNIGVIYDPQNMVMDGFETTPLAIQLLGDYLAHVHIGAHEPIRGELNADGVRQWTFRRTSMCKSPQA